ncbi:gliding motility-associated ABC transporter ATP-binding subunit GldA [Tenacibaculum finnmarkense genomovar ulcerans]|uniref:gliding motility-associated ABC transporter ATP-binding subunit GldA n=1 Tax=Tenacibaculum finnmarkense TaxID=2781243 RepID=UPI001E511E99|nr:gliding motility-associated ABC transporter ATP-binding subunit GldA [Tenacibaculum finnmarkense]MCD8431593.1 gliding motility-associated ABC transporter ATP-binding subunit GldA [Tenacibaculum finnmarkense genomovar ulcerans]MCD8443312.1 gliding motility-associated ABC transporter ATP-binding subunit GldA [Tenacibaculum finnmarkense genomovar ulcerans]MCG8235135.1 gliding motility-associated ABC transporter ATP-binding subunit GldA [Tenacibaculum finnmarkense genomovar ulcerans]MCG8802262.1
MSIQLTEISKFYGSQKAVNNISFDAQKGEIVGFLGPNGAGKSTSMKILTGFILPSEGSVFVSGIDVLKNPIEAQKKIGYLPEHNPLYLEMYVREYLQFQAGIYKVSKTKIAEVIEKVGLTSEAHKKIGQLSKGYRQRVGLAAAILHDPEVLILDEPTTGLDPNQLVEIRELIKELGKDKTVLISTHIMQEVEAVCTRVIIINKGKIVIDKPIAELKTSKEQIIKVTFDYKLEEQFIQRLPNIVHYKNTVENNWILTFETSEDMRPVIFDFAQENGLKILGLNTENKNLESLFRELTKE